MKIIEAIQIINFQKANVAITAIIAITVIMAVFFSNYDGCNIIAKLLFVEAIRFDLGIRAIFATYIANSEFTVIAVVTAIKSIAAIKAISHYCQ